MTEVFVLNSPHCMRCGKPSAKCTCRPEPVRSVEEDHLVAPDIDWLQNSAFAPCKDCPDEKPTRNVRGRAVRHSKGLSGDALGLPPTGLGY